mgnify:CR=1 FL=1
MARCLQYTIVYSYFRMTKLLRRQGYRELRPEDASRPRPKNSSAPKPRATLAEEFSAVRTPETPPPAGLLVKLAEEFPKHTLTDRPELWLGIC